MERNNPETSIIADRMMTKSLRDADHKKIIDALEVLGEGNYIDISNYLFWTDKNKVSRRLLEIMKDGKICLTGKTKLTPSNRPSQVYRILKEGETPPTINKEHYLEGVTSAADYASKLLAATKEGKLKQSSIFGD
jgi:hypothetical protein